MINNTNILKHIFAVEYGKNELTFKKQHNKMDNVWKSIHMLQFEELRCNLDDYMAITSNADVIAVLEDGLKEAHILFRPLNMFPSTLCLGKKINMV